MSQLATGLEPFAATLDKSDRWIEELMDTFGGDAQQAYRTLRAVLHALRDRMLPEEAVHLSAQLPMLIRGLYFEGWKLSVTPAPERKLDEFLQHVQRELQLPTDPPPEEAARAVFQLLERHVSGGEIKDVRSMLPADLQQLWS